MKSNNVCVTVDCKEYSHWVPGTRGCVCDDGYIGDPERGCVRKSVLL